MAKANNNKKIKTPSRKIPKQKNDDGLVSNADPGSRLIELEKVNQEIRNARRTALNALEDAVLSREL